MAQGRGARVSWLDQGESKRGLRLGQAGPRGDKGGEAGHGVQGSARRAESDSEVEARGS